MEIKILEKSDFAPVRDFYVSIGHNSASQLGDKEKILVAKDDKGGIIGAVRLANENGVMLLRTMEVLPEFQRQGVGSLLLKSFQELLGNQDCYCTAFGHLRSFYGQIGFKEISDEEAPLFLQERITDYRKREKNKGKELIIMKKSRL